MVKSITSSLVCLLILLIQQAASQNDWENITLPGDLKSPITCCKTSGNEIYIGTQGAGIYYLSSNGKIWTRFTDKSMDADSISNIIARGDYIIASGEMRLYVSTDKGQSWSTDTYFQDKGEYIQCISISSKLELVLGTNYAIYYGGAIDLGIKWSSISDKLGNIYCLSIQYDYANNLFACGAIWKSTYSIYQYNYNTRVWEERNGSLGYEPYVNQFIVGDNQGLYIRIFDRILSYNYSKQIWDEVPSGKIYGLTDFVQYSNYLGVNNLTGFCIFNMNNSSWTPELPCLQVII
ncbi:MAG: two component regulator propeller domain protein [Ignavibacteria bacterium]|nr:two component regulator propeller domain protein [Ignavibacteria bacterium]